MDVNCPYCDAEVTINHDDGYGYSENEKHEQQCDNCKKYFSYTTSILISHHAEKADCLNDGVHQYELSTTSPREFSHMECSTCGDSRELTDEERIKFSIGTKEDYFNKISKSKP